MVNPFSSIKEFVLSPPLSRAELNTFGGIPWSLAAILTTSFGGNEFPLYSKVYFVPDEVLSSLE